MVTVNSVINALTDSKRLSENVKEALRLLDPGFSAEEADFHKVCERLLAYTDHTLSPTPVDFLHALEQKFASSIIYITGQGFKLNLDIFQNPAFSLFLRSGEFEDITRERMLVSVPGVQKAQEVICAFYDTLRTLPAVQAQEIRNLTNAIAELYSHMEGAGYKLAHYFGFVLADRFLPYLIPGYHSDPVNTLCYQRMLSDYLEIDIHKLDG